MKKIYMYIIDEKQSKVYNPVLLQNKIYGRAEFPAGVNKTISRQHFEVGITRFSYYISDLNSKNGTIGSNVMLTSTPTKYTKENMFRIGSTHILISEYALYSEVDVLVKAGLVPIPKVKLERTSISLINITY